MGFVEDLLYSVLFPAVTMCLDVNWAVYTVLFVTMSIICHVTELRCKDSAAATTCSDDDSDPGAAPVDWKRKVLTWLKPRLFGLAFLTIAIHICVDGYKTVLEGCMEDQKTACKNLLDTQNHICKQESMNSGILTFFGNPLVDVISSYSGLTCQSAKEHTKQCEDEEIYDWTLRSTGLWLAYFGNNLANKFFLVSSVAVFKAPVHAAAVGLSLVCIIMVLTAHKVVSQVVSPIFRLICWFLPTKTDDPEPTESNTRATKTKAQQEKEERKMQEEEIKAECIAYGLVGKEAETYRKTILKAKGWNEGTI